MMGLQAGDQHQLFYLFNLERRIPASHLLRRINPIVMQVLADLREKLAPFYSNIGRPSIDPERRSPQCALATSTGTSIFVARGRFPHLRQANHARQRRPPTRSMAALTSTHLGRRAQIPIAPAAPPPPRPAVSFLGGFRTPAPLSVFVGTSVIGRHPKPFTSAAVSNRSNAAPLKALALGP
jgi:hypothetical protein